MTIKGNLQDMDLPSIITLYCNEGKQACLRVRHGEKEAVVFFDGGQVVHASLDSKEGEEVIYELLTWEEGTFEMEQNMLPPKHTITSHWQSILLDGIRRVDEQGLSLIKTQTIRSKEEKNKQEVIIMAIEEKLERFKEIEGFMGVGVFSKEGELLAAGKDSMLEMDMVGALVANMVGNAQKTSEELGLGGSDEIDIVTKEGANIFVRCYSNEKVNFSLILICEKGAQIGIIRLRLNQVLPTLVEDLA